MCGAGTNILRHWWQLFAWISIGSVPIAVVFEISILSHAHAAISKPLKFPDSLEELLSLRVDEGIGSGDHGKRSVSQCDTSSALPFTAQCGLECECIAGEWKCCRLRKSYSTLTEAEKMRFANAFRKATQDERFQPVMTDLMWSHASITCDKYAHFPDVKPQLLSYHRTMVLAFENLLRLIDCDITMPYWDIPSQWTPSWAQQSPFSQDQEIFGSNGVPPSYCVQDGMFSETNFKVPKFHYKNRTFSYPECLRRHFNDDQPPFSWETVQLVLTPPAHLATLTDLGIFQALDLTAHTGIGGSWANIGVGVDPMFVMIHNYQDKLFANYQLRGDAFKTGNGLWNHSGPLMNFPWLTASDAIDITDLPGGVCVKWAPSLPRETAIKLKYYAALEVPRTDHLYVPYEELRDMPYKNEDLPIIKLVLYYYKFHYHSFTFDQNGFHVGQLSNYTHSKLPYLKDIRDLCEPIFAIDPGFAAFNTSQRVEELLED
eukprot:scpid72606/ scgid19635/ 